MAKVTIHGADAGDAVDVVEHKLATIPTDFHHEVANDDVAGHRIIHKFGRVTAGTSFGAVAFGGVWQTVQPAAATALRVAAGNVNDDVSGSGAWDVVLHGLGPTGKRQVATVSTNGTSAGSPSVETFIRINRGFVDLSGTYATTSSGSHAADIVIENAAGNADWLTIDATGYPRGQTEIACFAIPAEEKAFINGINIYTDSTRSSDIIVLQRGDILKAAAPYKAMREVLAITGINNPITITPKAPLGPFPPLTDLIFLGKVGASTGDIVVDFEMVLEDA